MNCGFYPFTIISILIQKINIIIELKDNQQDISNIHQIIEKICIMYNKIKEYIIKINNESQKININKTENINDIKYFKQSLKKK